MHRSGATARLLAVARSWARGLTSGTAAAPTITIPRHSYELFDMGLQRLGKSARHDRQSIERLGADPTA
jgi:hypothetical protein